MMAVLAHDFSQKRNTPDSIIKIVNSNNKLAAAGIWKIPYSLNNPNNMNTEKTMSSITAALIWFCLNTDCSMYSL